MTPGGEPRATVTTYPDGPLVVRGDFTLTDVDGTELAAGRTIALCRCGRSAVKPFCDGTHKRAASVAVPRSAPQP